MNLFSYGTNNSTMLYYSVSSNEKKSPKIVCEERKFDIYIDPQLVTVSDTSKSNLEINIDFAQIIISDYYLEKQAKKNSFSFVNPIRDVTSEINYALRGYVESAQAIAFLADSVPLAFESYRYGIFYGLVTHGAAWDIKVPSSWHSTIGTSFPGRGSYVVFHGQLMTPENLGNYTYGYLGAAFGIPYDQLQLGSVAAAGIPFSVSDAQNEIGDWKYIQLGYIMYYLNYGG